MPKPRPVKRSINALPTKKLFIEMLTRDISLIPAILDLADNSADGARRMKGERKSWEGLVVSIEVGHDLFRITDNCGGIPVDTAENYAFRFGRDDKAPVMKHSVGQFGVGMKRAFFKIGKYFKVESKTAGSSFAVEQNVTEWAKDDEDWTFQFSKLNVDERNPESTHGTTIEITSLHDDVATSFVKDAFKAELRDHLRSRLVDPLSRGLVIKLNGLSVGAEPLTLLASDRIKPAFKELHYPATGKKTVNVSLYCGLGRSADSDAAGWHIFCNGRLVLEADKSAITGWNTKEQLEIPKFHNQYNYLRGYAYFDCDDAGRLPWNTTKTGLDTDSSVYRAVKREMVQMMRPVIDFLNKLKDEKQILGDDSGPLSRLLQATKEHRVHKVATERTFAIPPVRPVSRRAGSKMIAIQYERSEELVEEIKTKLRVRSARAVGERTFDYYIKNEVG